MGEGAHKGRSAMKACAKERSVCVCVREMRSTRRLFVVVPGTTLRRLGATRGLRHDDLVDLQHAGHSLHGELDGPELREEGVTDRRRLNGARLDVDARQLVAAGVRRRQRRQRLGALVARHLRQRARHDLEGRGEGADAVLVDAGRLVRELEEGLAERHVHGPGTAHEGAVAAQHLVGVDAVVDGTLQVVEGLLRCGADHNRRQPRVVLLLGEDQHLRGTDHTLLHRVTVAHVLGRGRVQLHDLLRADGEAEPLHLELRGDLHGHHLVLLDEVESEVAVVGVGHNDVHTRVGNLLHSRLEALFLALGEVEELVRVLNQDVALRLRGRSVDGAVVHRDLCALNALDRALRATLDAEAADQRRVVDGATRDLHDANVVDVEVLGVLLRHVDARVGHQLRQQVLVAVLLRGDRRREGSLHLSDVAVVHDLAGDVLLQQLQRLLLRHLVAAHDLRRLQTLLLQQLCVGKQLARKHDGEVAAVAHLLLHGLGRHHEQVGRRVLHLELPQDDGSVVGDEQLAQVVDDHLVEAVRAEAALRDLRHLLARLDVLDERVVLHGRALLQHGGQLRLLDKLRHGSSSLVTHQ
eukprot:Rhum_TRINITY_DN14731_c0_g1::Rhum_TRINITY_DN14731_c0_g1_i1::g.115325::m.115325